MDEGVSSDITEGPEASNKLECAVCLQPCVQPVELPCRHIFCYLCVKGVTQQSKKCAMCRQEIPLNYLDNPQLIAVEQPTVAFEGSYQWFYEGRNGWWQYDDRTSLEIEAAYKKEEQQCEVLIAGFLYVIDFQKNIQFRRSDPYRRRNIKRDLVTIPKKGVAGIRLHPENDILSSSSDDSETMCNSDDNKTVHTELIEKIADGNFFSLFTLVVPIMVVAVIAQYYRRGDKNKSIPCFQANSLLMYYRYMKSFASQTQKKTPFLCLLLQYVCSGCKLFDQDRIAQFWVFNRCYVFFFKPETLEVILKSASEIEKAKEYKLLEPWLGTGLLTSNGNKYRIRRKLLTPSFHFRTLDDFLSIFDEQSQALVSKLKTLTAKPWVDIVPLITTSTLDIICQAAMGVSPTIQGGDYSEYVRAVNEVGEMFVHRAIRPWLWMDSIFYRVPTGRKFKENLHLLHNFTRKVIKEKKQAMLENYSKNKNTEKDINNNFSTTKKRRAFLELLLEHHLADNTFTEEDIREEVDVFMLGGYDTTAMAISWTLYLLGLHPEVQENVYKELESIFEDDVNRPITRDDLARMKYLECVIKETLRLYPPLPIIGRELKEDIKVRNYKLCAGTVCAILPFILHRDPESFPNPEKFDPERFFPENCNGRHPYAYVPFSAGPRNCIGQKFAMMELKTVISTVLKHFRVVSLDQRDKVNLMWDLVLRNVDPLRMHFIARR